MWSPLATFLQSWSALFKSTFQTSSLHHTTLQVVSLHLKSSIAFAPSYLQTITRVFLLILAQPSQKVAIIYALRFQNINIIYYYVPTSLIIETFFMLVVYLIHKSLFLRDMHNLFHVSKNVTRPQNFHLRDLPSNKGTPS